MSLVLVVDDEPAVLEVLSQVVEDLGHDVLQARDGEEALGLARAKRPQLVVTDHVMPRLSGLELCRRLRSDEVLKNTPVILLSGVLPQGIPEASAFLHKPFEITDFEALIRKSLAQGPKPPLAPAVLPVEALGCWVAQTLQGPLAAARKQLQRLQGAPAVDRQIVEELEAQLRSMELLRQSLQEAARPAVEGGAVPEELARYLRRVEEAWRMQAAGEAPEVPGERLG
jgi:CheY-like chemotaxis protein